MHLSGHLSLQMLYQTYIWWPSRSAFPYPTKRIDGILTTNLRIHTPLLIYTHTSCWPGLPLFVRCTHFYSLVALSLPTISLQLLMPMIHWHITTTCLLYIFNLSRFIPSLLPKHLLSPNQYVICLCSRPLLAYKDGLFPRPHLTQQNRQ